MENQTHAQNQRVPVIQVSGLKKQYKLGQIGGGTLTHDLQSWWARVIPTPARRPRPAPRASMMGMILTCSARSNCKIQRKISI